MNDTNWKDFWKNYRNIEARNETDLFTQVGKTKNQEPISKEFFEEIVKNIQTELKLEKEDNLMEMCCGNGLFTYPLSFFVQKIVAFDFTELLLETAKKFKQRENIQYLIGDAKNDLDNTFKNSGNFNKFLMNDAAAYFTPKDILKIIDKIYQNKESFRFYMTNIPNDDKKWSFYNTPERRENYEKAVRTGDIFLNGMGRWWKTEEFKDIAQKSKLKISVNQYKNPDAAYRMNVLLYND